MSGILVQITANSWNPNDGHYMDWDYKNKVGIPKYDLKLDVQARFTRNVQSTPPAEYRALADAATAAHMAMGSAKMCGLCFAGELVTYTKGCCGSCVHLSDTGLYRA